MAKIVLVSEHVNATTWQLAIALQAQQHEIVLLTSYGESVADTMGIEFMAYFKNWSVLEGFRIIPGLFGLQAQILHLLLEEDQMNQAQVLLAAYAKSHPRCILTTSLLHIRKGLTRRNPVRYLIEESDIITCPTVETLGEVRGLNIRTHRQGRGILPPVPKPSAENQDEAIISASELRFLGSLHESSYVVLPFNEKNFDLDRDFFTRLRILAQRYTVILWGSYAHWSLRERKQFAHWMEKHSQADRWLVTGDISNTLANHLLHHSKSLVLAGLPLTPAELTDYFTKALQNRGTLILDTTQASVHGTLWKNGVNCWILALPKLHAELTQLLGKAKLHVAEFATDAPEQRWLDHPLNELNRLYNRALEQKN